MLEIYPLDHKILGSLKSNLTTYLHDGYAIQSVSRCCVVEDDRVQRNHEEHGTVSAFPVRV